MMPSIVVEEARKWVGVPFRHQGRDRNGIDCVGLPIVVCRDLALIPADFDTEVYGRLPTGEMISKLKGYCMPLDRAQPGALLVIAWTKVAAHVAICTGETMIHSYESIGKVVEHGYRGRWIRLTHSIWALPGVSYE